MSGHYATLLRGTVERMLPVADVYITDWRDAKLVPLSDGPLRPRRLCRLPDRVPGRDRQAGQAAPHMLAVCQPSVPCYAAACADERGQASHPARDADDDGRADRHARGADRGQHAGDRTAAFSWFEQNVIATIPMSYPGAGRRVYPGFLQLAGFMSMNLGNHMISHYEMFKHLVEGDGESADATKDFYDEYRAVAT